MPGLYSSSDEGRWLWFGGLDDELTSQQLSERIEGIGANAAKGGFDVRRLGSGAHAETLRLSCETRHCLFKRCLLLLESMLVLCNALALLHGALKLLLHSSHF